VCEEKEVAGPDKGDGEEGADGVVAGGVVDDALDTELDKFIPVLRGLCVGEEVGACPAGGPELSADGDAAEEGRIGPGPGAFCCTSTVGVLEGMGDSDNDSLGSL
jgi:hypothetical protein